MLINTFKNSTVFITGGASGIGFGMARAFAEQGMNIAIADIDGAQLQRAEAELQAEGVAVLAMTLDVTQRAAVKTAAEQAAKHFGGLHVCCANAGVSGTMGPLQDAADEDWDWVLDVNLKGSINTVQACLPFLRQHPGAAHIVITSSISGLRVYRPSRGQGMYNTSKFALMGFGEALALDLEPEQIGVSLICPGIVNTNITHSGKHRPERYGGAVSLNADHELGQAALSGTDPLVFGRWVLKAIKENRLFVPTHGADRALVEDRHRRIEGAFDAIPDLTK